MRTEKRGDCFEAAAVYILDQTMFRKDEPDRLVLVHAEVRGQAELEGKTFAHAWVENMDTGFAIDVSNGRSVFIPISQYRATSGVDEIGNEHRYEVAEMRAKLVAHWGPWDLECEL